MKTSETYCNDNVTEYIYTSSKSEFQTYCATLVGKGYELFTENIINSGTYAIYNNAALKKTLFVSLRADGTARVIDSPTEEMLSPIPQALPKLTNATFTMIAIGDLGNGENNGATAYGASFVIRLEDGRFVIIDGGTNTVSEIDKLYEYLVANKPAEFENPVISAWILTHPHGDHWACFYNFSKKYAHQVKLEKVLYNIYAKVCEDPGFSSSATGAGDSVHDIYVPEIMNNLDCETAIKLHTGQNFYLGTLNFEIMFTHEDLYPGTVETINDSSVVIKMTAPNGSVYLLTGDIEAAATKALIEQCGDELKCDCIQIVHHGWDSAGNPVASEKNVEQYKKLYTIANADSALWTAQLDDYHYNLLTNTGNMRLVYEHIGVIHSTKDGNYTITLSDIK